MKQQKSILEYVQEARLAKEHKNEAKLDKGYDINFDKSIGNNMKFENKGKWVNQIQESMNRKNEASEYTYADALKDNKVKIESNGDISCSMIGLTSLKGAPQKVKGSFYCGYNKLTSLEGAPKEVDGWFMCQGNNLTSLKGAPQKVSKTFDCSDNNLTSLEGGPKEVGGAYICSKNKLTSLKGAPKKISGIFNCSENKLTSLNDGPDYVLNEYYCYNNNLTSLNGAPSYAKELICDKNLRGKTKQLSYKVKLK